MTTRVFCKRMIVSLRSADDAVGRWTDGELELDISKKFDAAAQYRLRVVPERTAGVEKAICARFTATQSLILGLPYELPGADFGNCIT
jgi:hypothetical protein